jgi:hypothetical protein
MKRIKVRKGGKIVRVTENELEKYLGKGYEIQEEKGGAETPPTPTSKEQPKSKRRNRK